MYHKHLSVGSNLNSFIVCAYSLLYMRHQAMSMDLHIWAYISLFQVCVLLLHGLYTSHVLGGKFPEFQKSQSSLPLCTLLEKQYLLGFIPIFLFQEIQRSSQVLDVSLPFLPLMLFSVYCALGVMYTWLRYNYYVLTRKGNVK